MLSEAKLPVPAFLKVLTSGGISMSKAMELTPKLYKAWNSPHLLAQLTDAKLINLGILKKDERKQVLSALRKAGYTKGDNVSGSSSSPSRKRKRDADLEQALPDSLPDEGAEFKSLRFEEVTDESELASHFAVVNRAPIMTAWAMVVAERLGFKREEALSIASVYTEMNAISKGISLGMFEQGKGKGMEAASSGSQPYVNLMGRLPLLSDRTGQWRALSKGELVLPASAYAYISRSLRQTAPYIIGSMRVLSQSYTPRELNNIGFGLYAEFRPDVERWGSKGEVRCTQIMSLRKKTSSNNLSPQSLNSTNQVAIPHVVNAHSFMLAGTNVGDDGHHKRARTGMSLEEYEAALDNEDTFSAVTGE